MPHSNLLPLRTFCPLLGAGTPHALPPIRPLTRAEIESAAFGPLLWEAAGVDADALMHIRDAELPHLDVIGTVEADAASAGDVVGFTAFDRRPDHLELHYLAVSEAARGVGLGARLIDAVRALETLSEASTRTDQSSLRQARLAGTLSEA